MLPYRIVAIGRRLSCTRSPLRHTSPSPSEWAYACSSCLRMSTRSPSQENDPSIVSPLIDKASYCYFKNRIQKYDIRSIISLPREAGPTFVTQLGVSTLPSDRAGLSSQIYDHNPSTAHHSLPEHPYPSSLLSRTHFLASISKSYHPGEIVPLRLPEQVSLWLPSAAA